MRLLVQGQEGLARGAPDQKGDVAKCDAGVAVTRNVRVQLQERGGWQTLSDSTRGSLGGGSSNNTGTTNSRFTPTCIVVRHVPLLLFWALTCHWQLW
jgi:hypothetical protein